MLSTSEEEDLLKVTQQFGAKKINEINNTFLIHNFIIDLCRTSNPEEGIKISEENIELMNLVKEFNTKNIYRHKRLDTFKKYAELIIQSIYQVLSDNFSDDTEKLINNIQKSKQFQPVLCPTFLDWIMKYGVPTEREKTGNNFNNKLIYDLTKKRDYNLAIIDFLSGMTDNFAIKSFNEIITFM